MKTSAPALGTAAKKSPGLSMAKPAAWSSGSSGGGGISKPAGAGAGAGTTAATAAVAAAPSPLETDEGMQGFLNANPGYRSNLVDQLFAPTADAKEAAHNLADLVAVATGAGLTSAEGAKVVGRMVDDIHSGTAAADRALLLLQALIAKAGRAVEPFALPLLPRLLQLHADRSNAARDLATSLCATLAGLLSPHTFRTLWPMLTAGMVDDDWRVKCAALQMLKATAPRMSRQLSPLLPDIIPAVSVCIADAKKQVQTLALEALNEACLAITNDDIRHLTPMLVNVIAKPEESEKTLNKLLETTFVSNVDSATLALIAPLLGKVLRNRNTSQLKRKAARVIDNMCRLVREPADVAPFMPLLLPALEKMIDEIVDEEVCSVAKAARGILLKAFGEANATALSREASAATLESAAAEGTAAPPGAAATSTTSVVNPLNLDVQVVKDHLLKALHSVVPGAQPSALMSSVASDVSLEGLNIDEPADRPPPPPAATATATAVTTGLSGAARTVCEYVATLAAHLVVYDSPGNPAMPPDTAPSAQWRWALAASDPVSWRDCVTHYTAALRMRTATSSSANGAGGEPPAEDAYGDALAAAFRGAALGDVPDASDEADEDGGNVCDIEFSLAFGGKILLHNARLRLGRGRRYGIMGKNGAGKTTLLTNIGSGNIEGMPPHLKMVYVQHDDRTPDNGLALMDEIMAGKDIIEANVTRAEVEKVRNVACSLSFLRCVHLTLMPPPRVLCPAGAARHSVHGHDAHVAAVVPLRRVEDEGADHPRDVGAGRHLAAGRAHQPLGRGVGGVVGVVPPGGERGDVLDRVPRHPVLGHRHHRRDPLRVQETRLLPRQHDALRRHPPGGQVLLRARRQHAPGTVDAYDVHVFDTGVASPHCVYPTICVCSSNSPSRSASTASTPPPAQS